MKRFLTQIETAGNQAYIFESNKMRQNVGASELVFRSGTDWVLEAVANATREKPMWQESTLARAEALLDQRDEATVEVVVTTSGKALLLTDDRETAREIIGEVTLSALREAPGLDVCGATVEVGESFAGASKAVAQVLAQVRGSRPGSQQRFLRLPMVADCATTGLPAERGPRLKGDRASAPARAKYGAAQSAFDRMRHLVSDDERSKDGRLKKVVARSVEDLDEFVGAEGRWTAVVHADGNGIGGVFANLGGHEPSRLRAFSLALERATEIAFVQALEVIARESEGPERENGRARILPLVLGGDDVTVVLRGRDGLRFAEAYLAAFHSVTARPDLGDGRLDEAMGREAPGGLSACAGVAVTKPHFPFFSAYALAEQLIASAKEAVKAQSLQDGMPPVSALDFHVLYDSSDTDLATIRRRRRSRDGELDLHGGPYLVGDGYERPRTALRPLADLRDQLEVLRAGGARAPGRQIHLLRDRYSESESAGEAYLGTIEHRYGAIKELVGRTNGSLTLVDLLDLADIEGVPAR